jgi:hypothetical protein
VTNEQTRFRFDLIQEVLSVDDETRTIRFLLKPDPRRYERRECDGVTYLYDKFDDLWFREKEFMASLARQLEGQPVIFQPPRILSAADYVLARRSEIVARLEGKATTSSTFEDKSEEFLKTLAGRIRSQVLQSHISPARLLPYSLSALARSPRHRLPCYESQRCPTAHRAR